MTRGGGLQRLTPELAPAKPVVGKRSVWVLREAVDRGYDCLVLGDCVGASERAYHDAALTQARKATGVFGAVTDSSAFIAAISVSG